MDRGRPQIQLDNRHQQDRRRTIWLFRPDKGGEDVPDACFKIIVREEGGQPSVLAFIMPQSVNGTESPQQYLTSIHEIELETGLAFGQFIPFMWPSFSIRVVSWHCTRS
ncbi:MAG: hypothetical protein WCI95_10925 [bacterium]